MKEINAPFASATLPYVFHMIVTDPDKEPFHWDTEMEPPRTAYVAELNFVEETVRFPWCRVTFADIQRAAYVISRGLHERS